MIQNDYEARKQQSRAHIIVMCFVEDIERANIPTATP